MQNFSLGEFIGFDVRKALVALDPLSKILELPIGERELRGLVHTPREIFQQPDSWWGTFEKVKSIRRDIQSFLKQAGIYRESKERPSVFLIGAGTSDYVGRSVSTILRRSWQCEVCAVPSTDVLTCLDDLRIKDNPYLWVSFSRSGDSSEGVAILESALERSPETRHIIVCCNEGGRMSSIRNDAQNVCRIILSDEVNDKGLAMTSSYSNMVIAAQCLAHLEDLDGYGHTLESLIATARNLLPTAAEITEQLVAEKFSKICFLGTGPLQGVAVESALKVVELTAGRVFSFSESFLGVRHGPLSAIDRDTLVVAFVSTDQLRRAYELDLLEEIKNKKLAKNILTVAPVSEPEDEKRLANLGIGLQLDTSVADCYRPPLDVLIGQLFGLFASIELGLKPDAPSPSGAISRVVSKVNIY